MSEIIERHRRGELVDVEALTREVPELTQRVRQAFEALLLLEKAVPPRSNITLAPSGFGPIDPGRLGKYRILREIGRGAMGVVYEAQDEELGRRVAVKVLPPHFFDDHRRVERFLQEARAHARLDHPGLVPLFDAGEDAGVHYYAMKLIEGQSFDDVLEHVARARSGPNATPRAGEPLTDAELDRSASIVQSVLSGDALAELSSRSDGNGSQHGPLSEPALSAPRRTPALSLPRGDPYYRSIAWIGVQVAEALAYAHEQGVLHRDIKPSNILIDAQCKAWVTDFGLAVVDGGVHLTRTGEVVGTLRYMAPERFSGESGPASDIYSLGATLYEALALRPPFDSVDRAQLVRAITEGNPPRLRRLDPRVPRDLETIVLQAMAPDPCDRFASASLLADDLRRYLACLPLRSHRAGPIERGWRWSRRNPLPAALLALVVVLSLLAAIGGWVFALAIRESLRDSIVAQAKLRRGTLAPGRRFETMELLERAAAIRAAPEIRDEAISAMALVDFRAESGWMWPEGTSHVIVDARLERCAIGIRIEATQLMDFAFWQLGTRQEYARLCGKEPSSWAWAFSPDSRHLLMRRAAAGAPPASAFSLWDVERAEEALRGPASSRDLCAFSRDGRHLVISDGDRGLVTYDLPTRAEVRRITLPAAPFEVAWDPLLGRAAVCYAGRADIDVIDAASGARIARLPIPDLARGLAWHPSAPVLAAAADDGAVYLWNVEHPERLLGAARGHEAQVVEVQFDPGGRYLLSHGWERAGILWDVLTLRQVLKFPNVLQEAWGADGRLIVHNCRTAQMGRCEPPPIISRLTGSRSLVAAPDRGAELDVSGWRCATTGAEGVTIWDARRGREMAFLRASDATSARLVPCGAVVCGPGGLRLFTLPESMPDGPPLDLPAEAAVVLVEGRVLDAFLLADLHTLAIGDGARLSLVDLDAPQRARPALGTLGQVYGWARSADGRWLVPFVWQQEGLQVWDLEERGIATTLPGYTPTAAFDPTGRWFVTSSAREIVVHEIGVWEPRARQPLEGTIGPGRGLAISPDGKILACNSRQGIVELFSLPDLSSLAVVEAPVQTKRGTLAFTPDGSGVLALGQSPSAHAVLRIDLSAMQRGLARLNVAIDGLPSAGRDPRE